MMRHFFRIDYSASLNDRFKQYILLSYRKGVKNPVRNHDHKVSVLKFSPYRINLYMMDNPDRQTR